MDATNKIENFPFYNTLLNNIGSDLSRLYLPYFCNRSTNLMLVEGMFCPRSTLQFWDC